MKQAGRNKANRKTRRIGISAPEMTPMAGIGFLLLTFLILAASVKKSRAFDLVMPDRKIPYCGPPRPDKKDVLTLLIGEGKAYYYTDNKNDLRKADYTPGGMPVVLQNWTACNPNPVVLLAPTDKAKLQDLVDALDLMRDAGVNRYSLVDMTPGDEAKLEKAR